MADPEDADFTWLVPGPLTTVTSGEVKDDMDYRIVCGFFTPKAGTVNVAGKNSIAGHTVDLKRLGKLSVWTCRIELSHCRVF